MADVERRVVVDPEGGYRRLDPVPSEGELADYYRQRYYDEVRRRASSSALQRLATEDAAADRERSWLRATLWVDLVEALAEVPGRRVLEVGCGAGDLVAHLREAGFDAVGLEPSEEASASARARGLPVHCETLDAFSRRTAGREIFDGVVLLNVLEHVPDPAAALRAVRALAREGAVLVVRVPNDFNALQLTACERLGKRPWWVAIPDHVSYFDFASLRALIERERFEICNALADFPMELFVLWGDDYLADPAIGRACHRKRQALEEALPTQTRRRLYEALAHAGLGRNCLVVAQAR